MNYELMDDKLKMFIKVCKQTGNRRKLGAVSLILLGNVLDEIGVKLGLRPRKKDANETIFQYIILINSVMQHNFKIELFHEDEVNLIKTTEVLFNKYQGNIPIDDISKIYKLYYDFRKLEIPNLFEKLDVESFAHNSDMRAYSFLSGVQEQGKKKSANYNLKQVILQNLKEQELSIQNKLNKNYTRENFEKMITFKNVNAILKRHEGSKIMLNGCLKDNIIYQRSIPQIFGNMMMGLYVLFFILGLAIVIQTIYYPILTLQMSLYTLVFFSTAFFFFLLYRHHFKKGGVILS